MLIHLFLKTISSFRFFDFFTTGKNRNFLDYNKRNFRGIIYFFYFDMLHINNIIKIKIGDIEDVFCLIVIVFNDFNIFWIYSQRQFRGKFLNVFGNRNFILIT